VGKAAPPQQSQRGEVPAECFRDHIWVCFIRDEAGLEARQRIGVDKILFEADYPHSIPCGRTAKIAGHQLHDVPADEASLIAGATPLGCCDCSGSE